MLRGLRRFLILLHRYLGIPLSFLFVLWFASGIAMIYVGGMPALSPEQRLEHLPVLGRPAYWIDGETVFADDGESLAPLERETAREVAAKFSSAPLRSVRFMRT